jgi:hypothetical protein
MHVVTAPLGVSTHPLTRSPTHTHTHSLVCACAQNLELTGDSTTAEILTLLSERGLVSQCLQWYVWDGGCMVTDSHKVSGAPHPPRLNSTQVAPQSQLVRIGGKQRKEAVCGMVALQESAQLTEGGDGCTHPSLLCCLCCLCARDIALSSNHSLAHDPVTSVLTPSHIVKS